MAIRLSEHGIFERNSEYHNLTVIRDDGAMLILITNTLNDRNLLSVVDNLSERRDTVPDREYVTPLEYTNALAKFLGYELMVPPKGEE